MKAEKNTSILSRIDRHTHIPIEKLILKPPFPDAIKIEITSRCNYNCSFCATKRKLRPQGDMNPAFLYGILDNAKALGVKEIGMFLLGESLLVKELADHIRYAKNIGIEYVFLTTNGSLCDMPHLKPLIDAGLDSLKFSINAPTRESYKEAHGIDNFDLVINNVKKLHSYLKENNITSLRTCVSSIYDAHYKEEHKKFKDEISQYADAFYYLPLYNQAFHTKGGVIVGNPGRLDSLVDAVPCWALFNAAKITWDGWLTACCFDHDRSFEIADLHKTSLLDAWHHQKFQALRLHHLNNDLDRSLCARCLGIKGA